MLRKIQTLLPKINIEDEANCYVLALTAIGLNIDDLKIKVRRRRLTISGKKEESLRGFVGNGYSYSSFCHSFRLPKNVIKDKINIRYDGCFIKLTLLKKQLYLSALDTIAAKKHNLTTLADHRLPQSTSSFLNKWNLIDSGKWQIIT